MSSEVNNTRIDPQKWYGFTHPIWMQLRDSGFRYPKTDYFQEAPFHHKPQRSGKPPIYEFSLAGFHNPRKHTGLTPEAFLDLYIKRMTLKKKLDKVKAVEENRDEVFTFIRKHFMRTLKV